MTTRTASTSTISIRKPLDTRRAEAEAKIEAAFKTLLSEARTEHERYAPEGQPFDEVAWLEQMAAEYRDNPAGVVEQIEAVAPGAAAEKQAVDWEEARNNADLRAVLVTKGSALFQRIPATAANAALLESNLKASARAEESPAEATQRMVRSLVSAGHAGDVLAAVEGNALGEQAVFDSLLAGKAPPDPHAEKTPEQLDAELAALTGGVDDPGATSSPGVRFMPLEPSALNHLQSEIEEIKPRRLGSPEELEHAIRTARHQRR